MAAARHDGDGLPILGVGAEWRMGTGIARNRGDHKSLYHTLFTFRPE